MKTKAYKKVGVRIVKKTNILMVCMVTFIS